MDHLPVRITPARIRESIVQVYFRSDIPVEPLVGYLYSILGQEFSMSYSNNPSFSPDHISNEHSMPKGVSIQVGPRYFFFNNNVKIVLDHQGSLIFNCMDDYLGWSKYGEFIKAVLKSLMEKAIIKHISRIGVRYISEFANTDLLDKLKFKFSLAPIEGQYNSCSFAISWNSLPHLINLNLGNKLPIKPVLEHPEHQVIDFVSLIDVDVILENVNIEYFDQFKEELDDVHMKEKEVFFSLLNPDFLLTLNPEYPKQTHTA